MQDPRPTGRGARPQASRGRPPWAGTGSGRAGPHRAALGPWRSRAPAGASRSSRALAGGRPRAAERATLSRGRWPELGGINRVPPGLQLGVASRRLFLIVAGLGYPRPPAGSADSANHPGPERQRDPKADPGKGVGERPRQTKGGGGRRRPQTGRGGAPRRRKQSQAGPRGRRLGWGRGAGPA